MLKQVQHDYVIFEMASSVLVAAYCEGLQLSSGNFRTW